VSYKLFITGPVAVSEKTYRAMARPMIPHRSAEFVELYRSIHDLTALNQVLKTKHHLVIDTGYGKLKGKTFRISNTGDETDATIANLLVALDATIVGVPNGMSIEY
jgi:aspartate aminotransferase-like enzyme